MQNLLDNAYPISIKLPIMKGVSKKALQVFRAWGKNGGKKRAENLSRAARQMIARRAAQTRWGKVNRNGSKMASVRFQKMPWQEPAYLEEVLDFGSLTDWRELKRRIFDHPFGPEAQSLERVLSATHIYGVTPLWKGIMNELRGTYE
jgi:hypothetical protein